MREAGIKKRVLAILFRIASYSPYRLSVGPQKLLRNQTYHIYIIFIYEYDVKENNISFHLAMTMMIAHTKTNIGGKIVNVKS